MALLPHTAHCFISSNGVDPRAIEWKFLHVFSCFGISDKSLDIKTMSNVMNCWWQESFSWHNYISNFCNKIESLTCPKANRVGNNFMKENISVQLSTNWFWSETLLSKKFRKMYFSKTNYIYQAQISYIVIETKTSSKQRY